VRIEVPRTIADGAMTQFLGRHTFPIIRERVADIVTVGDARLVDAMRFFAERMKLVVEPTGAWPRPRRCSARPACPSCAAGASA
jgi:threonine dehydratase